MKNINQKQLSEAISCLDEDVLDDYLNQKSQRQIKQKRISSLCKALVAVAACFAIIVGSVHFLPMLADNDQDNNQSSGAYGSWESATTIATPFVTDSRLNLIGVPSFVYDSTSGVQSAPPAFGFDVSGFVVKAKATEIYKDTYSVYSGHVDVPPNYYRVIKMQTIESVRGENMPQYFLYLLPEHLYTDLTEYECLLLSLYQKGTSEFVIVNNTLGTAQCLGMPVFANSNAEYGNVIAFNDGIFDESLWQTGSWQTGYQFAKHLLDADDGSLFVSRGDTCQAVIDKISNESAMYFGKAPKCVTTLSFDTKEASDALSYVRLSDKNVFLQKYSAGSKWVSFVRYICGCVTDETVTIDLETGEVSYDGSRYSENDISALPDISFDIAKTVADYQLEIPSPPHIATDGKKLLQLYVSGAYFKKDDNTYGLVTTSWLYMDADDYYVQYQDKGFLLYNTSNGTAYAVKLQELAELLEEEMPDTEYGKPIEIPMC